MLSSSVSTGTQAFLATPIPEPRSILLLVSSLGGIVISVRQAEDRLLPSIRPRTVDVRAPWFVHDSRSALVGVALIARRPAVANQDDR